MSGVVGKFGAAVRGSTRGHQTASLGRVTRRQDSRQAEFATAYRWLYLPAAGTAVRFTAEYKPYLSRMLVARRSSSYTSGRKRLINGRRRAGWLPDTFKSTTQTKDELLCSEETKSNLAHEKVCGDSKVSSLEHLYGHKK